MRIVEIAVDVEAIVRAGRPLGGDAGSWDRRSFGNVFDKKVDKNSVRLAF